MSTTFRSVIEQFVYPHLSHYSQRILKEKEKLTVDGIVVFEKGENNWMIGGTTVNVLSYLYINQNATQATQAPHALEALSEMVQFTSDLYLETWGIAIYLEGLHRLHHHHILERVVDDSLLDRLKEKLDWHTFFDVERQSLPPNYPTNYYGVAYTIARYRELLGWGNLDFDSTFFMQKLTDHIHRYSGEWLYMDDSKGKGRYDRYTLVLPAEMCLRFLDMDVTIPPLYLKMLRKSCDIVLQLANCHGNGVSYGRSLGPFGDMTGLEVLPVAAYLGLLTEQEMELAYGYTLKIAEKYVSFWHDQETNAVNMWDKGRKVDPYRSKDRILNEDLNLCIKLLEAGKYWRELGLDQDPLPTHYVNNLQAIASFRYFPFEQGEYARGLAIIRDGTHVISLPIIGGHYQETPYLPIPSENNMLMTSPKTKQPFLVPVVVLSDGSRLMPVEYMNEIFQEQSVDSYQVSYKQAAVCAIGKKGVAPHPDLRLRSETEYRFQKGLVERVDRLYPQMEIEIAEIRLEVALFSDLPAQKQHEVSFSNGDIYNVQATGFNDCTIYNVSDDHHYHTPDGALKWKVEWTRKMNMKTQTPLTLSWCIRYR